MSNGCKMTASPLQLQVEDEEYQIETTSFWLNPIAQPEVEAAAFLKQMAHEVGVPNLEERLATAHQEFAQTGTWEQTYDEIAFGAKIAWRNSVRCIGRMFWPSLKVFDARHVTDLDGVFETICEHIKWATNDGDLRPALTVFNNKDPEIRIFNPQMILYAGYQRRDGSVIGDPKNVELTNLALSLGWRSEFTEYDVLPLIMKMGSDQPKFYEIPKDLVLEVAIHHPDSSAFAKLNLKWFALPAVSGMALDIGGVQYKAAPSSGVYQGTEIGSINLADPARYNKLAAVAEALGIDTGKDNPLWRDQAMIELNRAVLYSFKKANVRIMDHHSLSESFQKFCVREEKANRNVYGHWPWLIPPLSPSLSGIWGNSTLKKVIQKPGYFYQKAPALTQITEGYAIPEAQAVSKPVVAAAGCPFAAARATGQVAVGV